MSSRAAALELLLFTLVAAGLGASMPLSWGGLGWSWDALNHHIYLGYIAEHARWDRDVMAASVQSYQWPYLYWPVYRMSLLPLPGAWVGAAWSAAQAALLVPPVWFIARGLLPAAGRSPREGFAVRLAACAMAGLSAVVINAVDTTSNDLLASLPLLWAFALALPEGERALAQGVLSGVSVAFKLSNAMFVPFLLPLWWWQVPPPQRTLRRAVQLFGGAVASFILLYLPWGWQLWHLTGNPFYPMAQGLFGSTWPSPR